MASIHKKGSEFFVFCGHNILYCDSEIGTDQHVKVSDIVIPASLQGNKTGYNITSVDFFAAENLIAVSTENKLVVIYDKDFQVVQTFLTNRIASKVRFTPSKDILVADKTGDVYLYKFDKSYAEPKLLLGHRSMVLDLNITDCGKYLITCDRDEKIRVSHFPNCYNIASFCLGHSEFVTCINVVKDALVSASGDGTVRVWDFKKGLQLSIIDVNEHVEETGLLSRFAEQVKDEKIDVCALPVTDMQTYASEQLYLAVSVHSYNAVQIYAASLEDYNFRHLRNVTVAQSFRFSLCECLYVLSDQIGVIDYKNGESKCDAKVTALGGFVGKYKDVIKIAEHTMISLLYKRKFDNVQEYLERKKQRLEIK